MYYDLVILDMLMPPGMNGCQTFRGILDLHPRQKAILTSGFSESRDVREALAAAIQDTLKNR